MAREALVWNERTSRWESPTSADIHAWREKLRNAKFVTSDEPYDYRPVPPDPRQIGGG